MSINHLKDEFAEVSKKLVEAQDRKNTLAAKLEPYIDKYFSSRIPVEHNPEIRRDYAYFNKTKNFGVLDNETLRFYSSNRSGPISLDVKVADLLED